MANTSLTLPANTGDQLRLEPLNVGVHSKNMQLLGRAAVRGEMNKIIDLLERPELQAAMRFCEKNNCEAVISNSWFRSTGIFFKQDLRETLILNANGLSVRRDHAFDHDDNQTSCDREYSRGSSRLLTWKDLRRGNFNADDIFQNIKTLDPKIITEISTPRYEDHGSRFSEAIGYDRLK